MIRYKLKKKDYVVPHISVMCMDEEALLDDQNGSIYGEGPDMPPEGEWGAKSSGVTHFDSGFDFEDDFEDSSSGVYESYKVEW